MRIARIRQFACEIARRDAQAFCVRADNWTISRRKARQRFIALRKSCTAIASVMSRRDTAARPSARMSRANARSASPMLLSPRNPSFAIDFL